MCACVLVCVLEMSSNEGWAANTTTFSLLRKSEQENPSQGSGGVPWTHEHLICAHKQCLLADP